MDHLNLKPSKYADFMQAAKVRTPKYKFHIEVGGIEHTQTILLIMGVGAQHLAWPREFCQALIDAGYRVIRFDNRDIGKSSKLKRKNKLTKRYSKPFRQAIIAGRFKIGLSNRHLPLPYDLYDMTEDVRQLMIALEIEKCHVIGMSMGGMIAQILAAQHPERVDHLGLISTSNNRPFSRPPSIRRMAQAMSKPKDKNDEEAVIEHIAKTLKAMSSPSFYDENRARKKAKLLYNRRFYPKGMRRHVLAVLATGSLKAIDQQIQQPTLVLHGEQDKIIPISHGRSVANNINGAVFISIPKMGHEIPISLASEIAQHFIKFYADDE